MGYSSISPTPERDRGREPMIRFPFLRHRREGLTVPERPFPRETRAMSEARIPAWLEEPRWFCSLIGAASAQPVAVFDATDCDKVGEPSGILRLRLEPRFRYSPVARVLNADGREEGIIRPEGFIPGASYAMRRDGELVWTLSVRSIVRRRHVLRLAHGNTWTFHTPFFSTRLTGEVQGDRRLIGGVGPGISVWRMAIERGRDTLDLLAAVAFLHRQWNHF